jgi:hypothetical protein
MTEAELAYLVWLIEEGEHRHVRLLPNGHWAAIRPMMFTTAIVTGRMFDRIGYDDRWCYHDMASAQAALDAWDGTGEPEGWHRHPGTGRRVSRSPDEIGEDGRKVGAIGVAYVRG